ncbi:oxidoreductase [Penicillium macrosclerotiorum]|uniref:oxidoreductase n=1 Tax=Penicillium macrosclerotiorum TaxID=303699 RepID=UPI0025496EF9|nr:oxidoreductase [Penicillium macrosclerotiorum]KAJ5691980.1 oxidoreductase [Penicillium macrosclerotiorum]
MAAKTIIVTGASRGLGLAMAKYLLSAPQAHNVVVVARTLEPLQKLKEQYSSQVEVVNGDLADFSMAQKAVDAAIKSFGQLDGMILNHGILGQVGKIADADIDEWKKCFDVNFFSLVAFTKAALPALRESKGKIIFTSSGAAVTGYPGWGLYGGTKATMNHLALTLGSEEPEVTSVSIQPGMVDTEMQRELREDHATNLNAQMHAKFVGAHKDGKLVKPEESGHVIAKLALDAPKDLSGRSLRWNSEELGAFQA